MNLHDLVSADTRFLELEAFELESGAVLRPVKVAHRTWGRLSPARDNAVLVCHALTGSADADSWWPGLVGPGRVLDPGRDFIVCCNVLGSCYGTTGPTSPGGPHGEIFGPDFPAVTVRDMVRLQLRLLDRLGIRRLRLVIGGSLGGMQALEWAALGGDRVEAVVAIATSGRHSPWCIALSETQRAAIRADRRWRHGRYDPSRPPRQGLAAARMMAMCTYRSSTSFAGRFGRTEDASGAFHSESYLRHHGDKLVRRFDANSYITLTRAMDSHDLGRGRGPYHDVLHSLEVLALIVAIDSDLLYPPHEQIELAEAMPNARLGWLRSPHGHDAFLIETRQLDRLVRDFRAELSPAVARAAC